MASGYRAVYAAWKVDPEGFWAEVSKNIEWTKPFDKVFDPELGEYGRWFVGGELNTCYNCIDRHIEAGRGDQPAIIYDSPVTGHKKTYTYQDAFAEIGKIAAVLKDCGVSKGDRVILYMPMVPEAVFSMLACARIGAVHSVVFGGFAARELSIRIDDSRPKLVIAASCGLEPGRIVAYKPLLDAAIDMCAHKPDHCLILQRDALIGTLIEGRDLDMAEMIKAAEGRTVPCVPVLATDPLYILYTSGTTGVPKGVVRDTGGHLAALLWTMDAIYDVRPGEVFWAASDVGWVVGHSYIVYGPLAHGSTTLLFEGKPVGTPDASAFWRVIEEHKVVSLFTAPTAFRAIKREDPAGLLAHDYDLSHLRSLFLAGERADPDTILWAEKVLGVPVIDHWWQTETGWTIAGNPLGLGQLPMVLGSPTVPMPGYDLQILDDSGHKVENGTLGNIVLKLPLPPGSLPTLWQNNARFRETYLDEFPGYYKTADAGYVDENGYVFIMARTDDIINVAGHRLSTGGMEEIVANHPDVAECAVIGVSDPVKGQIPAGFIVINSNVTRNKADIEAEVIQLVRDKIGPVAAFKQVFCVKRLPKTRSGKILRATMRALADGETFNMPATIDDPAILDEIAHTLGKK